MSLTYEDFLKMVETLEKNKVPGPYYIAYIGDGSRKSRRDIQRWRRHINRLFRGAKLRSRQSNEISALPSKVQ